MEPYINTVTLRGNLSSTPEFSHANHGRMFYRFYLQVSRLSQAVDILPVIAEKSLLEAVSPEDGSMITVTGQVRSHNLRYDGKRHLLIFVFAYSLAIEDGDPLNLVEVEGPICRDPIHRRTPLGREICDIMLAVPRAFQRADYLPCILWGRTAQEASACQVRDVVKVSGRLQSRNYTKITPEGAQVRTAYEISALSAQFPF